MASLVVITILRRGDNPQQHSDTEPTFLFLPSLEEILSRVISLLEGDRLFTQREISNCTYFMYEPQWTGTQPSWWDRLPTRCPEPFRKGLFSESAFGCWLDIPPYISRC